MDVELYNAAIDGSQELSEKMKGSGSYKLVTWWGQKNTILHIAAKSGNLRIAEGDDDHPALRFLYYQNREGNTPLHIAAKSGHLEMVRILVDRARRSDKNTEPNWRKLVSITNSEKNTALHEAVRYNRLDVVKFLIEEDPNLASLVNSSNESPLFMAVDRCFDEVAKHILSNTAASNCSYQGRNGMNVMHPAAIRSEMFNIIKGQIPLRMLMDKADDFGWIPLHYAAHLGNREVVELFLDHNNNSLAYQKNEKGMSALHISAMKGYVDVVRTLINKCPDICELKDDRDWTALHVAVESRKEEVVKFLLESLAFQDLLNEKDNEGNTALHIAAATCSADQRDLNILEMLAKDSNIDRGARNKDGRAFSDIILSNKQLEGIEFPTTIMSKLEREMGSLSLEQKLKLKFRGHRAVF